MRWLEAAVAALMGAAAMSFLQLTIDRAAGPVGLLERSRCPRCAAGIGGWEVAPIVGFLLLRGHCRTCGSPIPRQHLLGEVLAAGFWAVAAVLLGRIWWLPVVLVAPLVVMLLGSALRSDARALLAGLLPLMGVALLTYGVVGLLEGRPMVYGVGGGLGASALLAGIATARRAAPAAQIPQAPQTPQAPGAETAGPGRA